MPEPRGQKALKAKEERAENEKSSVRTKESKKKVLVKSLKKKRNFRKDGNNLPGPKRKKSSPLPSISRIRIVGMLKKGAGE